jgi:acetyl esterase/lipase
VTTTPVPPGGVKPFRSVGDSLHYNAIARDVVEPRGIEVLDLYQPALDHQQEWQLPANVHFSKTGSAALAALVAQTARRQLNQACPDWSIAKQPWTADPATVERLGASGEFNYRESAVPKFELPHVFDTGTTKTAADWQRERPGLVGRFADIIYGRAPPQLANASCLFTSRMMEAPDGVRPMTIREITVVIGAKEDPLFSFPFLLFQPPGSGPFPSIVLIHNREYPDVTRALQSPTGFLPVEMLIERGFAVAVFHTSQVEPDRADAAGDGIREACRLRFGDDRTRPDYWGCLTAWAWGASRVAEYLASQPEFDPEKIAVIGHSRGGKTALWAAAGDQRFAAAISNESGCAGAALSRRAYGETIGRISTVFPYWFAPRFAEYAGRENELPLDQHQLIGLIAPRCVAIGSAAEDLWADPRGEYLALVNAGPAFGRFGLESIHEQEMPATGETRIRGRTCYHVRAGSHNLTESDWIRYLEFLEIQGHKAPPN